LAGAFGHNQPDSALPDRNLNRVPNPGMMAWVMLPALFNGETPMNEK